MENIRDYIFDSKLAAEKTEEICRQALKDKYGDNPPELITCRLNRELEIITENHYAEEYLLAMGIAGKSKELGFMHTLRGSDGSSFAAFLMRIANTNPLPPHYYCSECKHVEFADEIKCYTGYDLIKDKKVCPVCGKYMVGDGHNLPYEALFGPDGKKPPDFKFNVAYQIKSDIDKYLQEIFGEDKVFQGCYKNKHSKLGTESLYVRPGAVFICPKNVDIYDIAEVRDSDGDLPTIISDCSELKRVVPLKEITICSYEYATILRKLEESTKTSE